MVSFQQGKLASKLVPNLKIKICFIGINCLWNFIMKIKITIKYCKNI
jgi:hypothetical protein